MKMPGFTAEASLYKSSKSHNMIIDDVTSVSQVVLAIPNVSGCINMCKLADKCNAVGDTSPQCEVANKICFGYCQSGGSQDFGLADQTTCMINCLKWGYSPFACSNFCY